MTQQKPEEPLNVQVARALGCHPRFDKKFHRWYCPDDCDGDRILHTEEEETWIPDFASDPAWVVRTIEANGLYTATGVTGSEAWSWETHATVGESLGEAVCRWVVAAHEAGIEVKQ